MFRIVRHRRPPRKLKIKYINEFGKWETMKISPGDTFKYSVNTPHLDGTVHKCLVLQVDW